MMHNQLPFEIESISWGELSDSQRDFFCFEDQYLPLPKEHALQIQRLTAGSAKRIWPWLSSSLPKGWPASEHRFSSQITYQLDSNSWNSDDGMQAVRQWLHELGIPYSLDIFLVYESNKIVRMPWKLVIKYWNALSWSVGHSMIAMAQTRQWACCFHHEEVIKFGTFAKRMPQQSDTKLKSFNSSST